MKRKLLYLFTRTPLHVGAGSSVGAIDQPIVRERHTGFPVIPASSLKGTFADQWTEIVSDKKIGKDGMESEVTHGRRNADEGVWLFGSDDANNATAGALQFSEAKLLAFPVRSAKGGFAWITCPLILRRAAREGVLPKAVVPACEPSDNQALFAKTVKKGEKTEAGPIGLDVTIDGQLLKQVVLEEYTFTHAEELPDGLGAALQEIMKEDDVWREIPSRLVVLSNGMMSFFTQSACEVAQHVAIDDAKGTAKEGALFNQENVPSETVFFTVMNYFKERRKMREGGKSLRSPDDAAQAFSAKIDANGHIFQFGGDASTGLGFCTVELKNLAH